MASLNEEDTDPTADDSTRHAFGRKASQQRLSSASQTQPCTIRHMKVKERSCSERSDSGFSECEKKSIEAAKVRKDSTTVHSGKVERILNANLLKNKLERIASLQFDEEENIIIQNPKVRESTNKDNSLWKSSVEDKEESPTEVVNDEVKIVSPPVQNSPAPKCCLTSQPRSESSADDDNDKSLSVDAAPQMHRVVDPMASELDYDIKRYHLDGNSLRSRKKSLENQAKKELSVAAPQVAPIRVSNRVSDLKSRFDSGPISPAIKAAAVHSEKSANISTLKINFDRGSTKMGNKSFDCVFEIDGVLIVKISFNEIV